MSIILFSFFSSHKAVCRSVWMFFLLNGMPFLNPVTSFGYCVNHLLAIQNSFNPIKKHLQDFTTFVVVVVKPIINCFQFQNLDSSSKWTYWNYVPIKSFYWVGIRVVVSPFCNYKTLLAKTQVTWSYSLHLFLSQLVIMVNSNKKF